MARQGKAWHGKVRGMVQGKAWRGRAWRGMARQGSRHGVARLGVARLGEAWHGKVHGVALELTRAQD